MSSIASTAQRARGRLGRLIGATGALVCMTLSAAGATPRDATSARASDNCGARTFAAFHHGDANDIIVQGVDCVQAKQEISYALSRGAVHPLRGHHSPGSGQFGTASRRFRGWRFTASRHTDTITARRGSRTLAFDLCWYNVDC